MCSCSFRAQPLRPSHLCPLSLFTLCLPFSLPSILPSLLSAVCPCEQCPVSGFCHSICLEALCCCCCWLLLVRRRITPRSHLLQTTTRTTTPPLITASTVTPALMTWRSSKNYTWTRMRRKRQEDSKMYWRMWQLRQQRPEEQQRRAGPMCSVQQRFLLTWNSGCCCGLS